MSDLDRMPVATAPRSRWRGHQLVLLLLLLPLLALPSLYISYSMWAGQELKDALEEMSRSDPRWRLEDVEADRETVPEARNGALTCIAAKKLLPEKWPAWQHVPPAEDADATEQRHALELSFQQLEPRRQLNKDQIETLKSELKSAAAAALAEARKLTDQPWGRFPITYSADFVGTLLPDIQGARDVAQLLGFDVMLRAQEEDADGSLASCRALLNCGRAVGDEPIYISQLVRIALRLIAVRKIERTLAQSQPSEDALRQMQQLLEKEEPENLLLNGARGERAGADRLMEALQTGKMQLSGTELGPLIGDGEGRVIRHLPAAMIKSQRVAMLRYQTQIVEAARLPPQQQQQAMEKVEATAKEQPALVRLFAPAVSKVTAASLRSQVELRCAIVAVAAERFRREKSQWPDSLEALKKAGYLKQIPSDVFGGQPVRLRRLEDGLVIYSVGPDGDDNGGYLDRTNPIGTGTDLGFRLWDMAQRRQPPAPAKPPQPPREPGE